MFTFLRNKTPSPEKVPLAIMEESTNPELAATVVCLVVNFLPRNYQVGAVVHATLLLKTVSCWEMLWVPLLGFEGKPRRSIHAAPKFLFTTLRVLLLEGAFQEAKLSPSR